MQTKLLGWRSNLPAFFKGVLLSLCGWLLSLGQAQAQLGITETINGPSSVTYNSTHTLSIANTSFSVNSYTWSITSGSATIVSSYPYDCNIKFSSSGTVSIKYQGYDVMGFLHIATKTINVSAPPPPPTPSTPLLTNHCNGTSTLSFNGSPPSGVTWYWHKNGSNLGATSSSYTTSSAGNYSLRSYSSAGGWGGTSSSVAVNPYSTPAKPTLNSATKFAGAGAYTL